MSRERNTDTAGKAFSNEVRLRVWSKGQIAPSKNSEKYRLDHCGALIMWDHYGDTSVNTGWEIDHMKPVAQGGGDLLENLQPLQWENNRHKSDKWPSWTCLISD